MAWSAHLFDCPVFCVKSITDIVDGGRPTQVRPQCIYSCARHFVLPRQHQAKHALVSPQNLHPGGLSPARRPQLAKP